MLSNDGQFRFEDGEEIPIEDDAVGQGVGVSQTAEAKLLRLIVAISVEQMRFHNRYLEARAAAADARQTMNAIQTLPERMQEDYQEYDVAQRQLGLYSSLQRAHSEFLQELTHLMRIAEGKGN